VSDVTNIYELSRELESAVRDLFAREEFLWMQKQVQNEAPSYIQALRLLKSFMPSAFQIRRTGAAENHPGDLLMWEILTARETDREGSIEPKKYGFMRFTEYEEVSRKARLAVESLAFLRVCREDRGVSLDR
jgi:hypothetical protein